MSIFPPAAVSNLEIVSPMTFVHSPRSNSRTHMGDTLVGGALGYLVSGAAGMFIWATTIAKFLRKNPN